MDDIRPPRNSTNYQSPSIRPAYSPAPTQRPDAYVSTTPGETPTAQQELSIPQPTLDNNYSLKPDNKTNAGLIITLVIFILLFLGSAGFAGYQYMQNQQLQEDVAELKKETDRLTQKIYSLEYDNRDLNQQLELANSEISSLEETKKLILDTCGNACANILH